MLKLSLSAVVIFETSLIPLHRVDAAGCFWETFFHSFCHLYPPLSMCSPSLFLSLAAYLSLLTGPSQVMPRKHTWPAISSFWWCCFTSNTQGNFIHTQEPQLSRCNLDGEDESKEKSTSFYCLHARGMAHIQDSSEGEGERERRLKCHCLSRPSMMNQWFTCLSWEREQLTDGERTTKNNNLKVEWEEKTVTVILFRYEGLAFTIHSSARYIHMYMYISGRSSCSVVMSIAIRIIGTHHAGRFIAVTVV